MTSYIEEQLEHAKNVAKQKQADKFFNTRYEKIADEIARLEEERDFDKAMAFARQQLRLVITSSPSTKWDRTDFEFLHFINPYER